MEFDGSKKGSLGATVVEMALITPLLAVLVAAMIDLCLSYMGQERIHFIASKTAHKAALASSLNSGKAAVLQASAESEVHSIFGANQLSVAVSTPFDDPRDTIADKVIQVSVTGPFQHIFLGLLGITTHQVKIDVYMRYESQNLYVAPP